MREKDTPRCALCSKRLPSGHPYTNCNSCIRRLEAGESAAKIMTKDIKPIRDRRDGDLAWEQRLRKELGKVSNEVARAAFSSLIDAGKFEHAEILIDEQLVKQARGKATDIKPIRDRAAVHRALDRVMAGDAVNAHVGMLGVNAEKAQALKARLERKGFEYRFPMSPPTAEIVRHAFVKRNREAGSPENEWKILNERKNGYHNITEPR